MASSTIPPDRDLEVTKTVYIVGRELDVSDKVMIAGFEAGWVESRMNNLRFGDRDSLGVFQQRPSQGWGTAEQIMHVPYAATQFFTRAIRVEQRLPNLTAGQTAQEVQRSGFPLRYDQAEAKARDLIDEARRAVGPRPYSARVSAGVPGVVDTGHGMVAFGVASSGEVIHQWQTAAGGAWSEWTGLGKPGDHSAVGRPTVVVGRDGGMVLFARGMDNQVHHRWQNAAGGAWSDWTPLGGQLASDVCAVINPNGALSLFAQDTQDRPVHTWQHGPEEGFRWHESWVDMGGPMQGRPTAVVGRDGGMVLFARGMDNQVHHRWQNAAGGAWSDWTPLGGDCSADPSAVLNPNGAISVFIRNHAGHVLHTWQLSPEEGFRWHESWADMNGPINT